MHGEQIFLNQEELAVYTRETKLRAIHRYLNGNESYRKIALELGLTDANILRDWVSLFKEKGEDAIQDSHRQKNYMLPEDRMNRIADAEIADRIKYLEAENDYLKKLYSLIQARG
ncbi:transposase [uncultured Dysosmobacter sp.]|uniref:transposase n=1 Tax=uncultured Dysosmobacter sp. TaxID=2591384 RepID=UPI00261762E3|nr:transposase [uncultured Dysosmobacter sp.]